MSDLKMVKTRTPGIFKRGSRYVVAWRHRGVQHRSSFRTMVEARDFQGGRRSDARRPPSRAPFDEYAVQWLAGYAGRTNRGVGAGTLAEYRTAIETHAVPHFQQQRLADIEPPDVRALVGKLEAFGLAPGSVSKYLAPVRALFATAVEDGALRSNPCTGVRVNRTRRPAGEHEDERAKAMTEVELAGVLAEIPDSSRLIFELLSATGVRISEALGLEWSDVEFGARPMLHVRRQCYRGRMGDLKTASGRRDLPLPTRIAQALWVARHGVRGGTSEPAMPIADPSRPDPVFTTSTGGRVGERNLRRTLQAAAARAGVPWIGFHSFRHTCASMLIAQGKNPRQLAAWLGHADPAFTLRVYVHLMDDGLGAPLRVQQNGNTRAAADGNQDETIDTQVSAFAGFSG
jgi:integrase